MLSERVQLLWIKDFFFNIKNFKEILLNEIQFWPVIPE